MKNKKRNNLNNIKKILENIIKDKKKLKVFLFTELCIFTILVTALTYSIIKQNTVIETAEIANVEIEQNETPQVVEEDKEPAQELNEEEQEKVEEEENLEKKDEKQKDKQTQNNPNQVSSNYGTSYYIKVNYGANVVTIYSKGADGNYTPIKAMVCSTGRATPKSGTYSLKSTKHRWGALFGGVWGQYTTQIVGNILFHSVPYLSANPSNLEYWEYDKLGTTASAGCVRLRVCDAKWIYECMPAGTPVEFYSDSNPGPLGKPGAQKISGNEQCRGWDPTDPDGNNPWRNIVKESEPAPQPAPTPAPQPAQNITQENKKSDQDKKQETKSDDKEKNEKNKTEKEDNKENKDNVNNTEKEKTETEKKEENKEKEEKPKQEDNKEPAENTTNKDENPTEKEKMNNVKS